MIRREGDRLIIPLDEQGHVVLTPEENDLADYTYWVEGRVWAMLDALNALAQAAPGTEFSQEEWRTLGTEAGRRRNVRPVWRGL